MKARMHRERVVVERDDRLGLDCQSGSGRSVIIAGVGIDRERLAWADRPVRGGELDLELRRDKILHTEFGGADRRRFRVEKQLDPPGADAGIARQREAFSIGAQSIPCQLPLFDLDPIRPQQPQSDRQTRHRIGLVVAHQRDQLDRLAGPVDAAICIEKRVHGPGLRPAVDATVAQIESGAADLEKIEVAVRAMRRQNERLVAAAAAQQSARELRDPDGVAGRCGEFAVVAGIEANRDTGHRLAVGERADVDRQLVRAFVNRQAEIGDENPIRRRLGVLVLHQVGAFGNGEIDAGPLFMEHVLQGDGRRDRTVALAGDSHLSFPDEAAGAVDDFVDLVRRKAHRQPLGVEARDEVALVDPQQAQFDLVEINCGQRQPRRALFGQHIAGAGKAQLRLAVGNDDPRRERLAQALAGSGREAGEDFDLIGAAMLHAVEAHRVAAGGHDAVERRLAANKGAVGDIALMFDGLVEPEARAAPFRFGLDLDLGDAEGDEPAQFFGALGNRRQPGEIKTGVKRGERLLLLVVPVVIAADYEERHAAFDRIGRFKIGVVGARHRVVVLGSELVLRETQPNQTVIGAIGDGAGQFLDRRGVALGLVIGFGGPPPAGDQRGLLLVRRDAVDQLPAPIARRIG